MTKSSIKAEELRIGNYILSDREYFDTPVIGKIYQISSPTCFFEYMEESVNELRGISNPTISLKPITLTGEWLLKFGADTLPEREQPFVFKDFEVYISDDGRISCYWRGIYLEKSPQYVHKFQNIFFELEGEELTLKGDK